MPNLWRRFQSLLPQDPVQLAEVISHSSGGTSIVESPDGQQYRVRGQDVAVGQNAFVQGGEIVDEAPDLPFHDEFV